MTSEFLTESNAPKPYQASQIVLEIELETQAGSPLSLPDFDDELGETP